MSEVRSARSRREVAKGKGAYGGCGYAWRNAFGDSSEGYDWIIDKEDTIGVNHRYPVRPE